MAKVWEVVGRVLERIRQTCPRTTLSICLKVFIQNKEAAEVSRELLCEAETFGLGLVIHAHAQSH